MALIAMLTLFAMTPMLTLFAMTSMLTLFAMTLTLFAMTQIICKHTGTMFAMTQILYLQTHWHSVCNDTDTLFAMTLTLYPHEAPPGSTPYSCHCLLVGPVPGLLSSSHPLPHPPLPLGPTAQHLKANEMRNITGFMVTSNFWYLTNFQLRSAYTWTKSVIH